jgi:acetyl-CoA C-acetyltransferase
MRVAGSRFTQSVEPTEALIFDAIRTPRGRGKSTGSLHGVKPVSLVAGLIHELLARPAGLDPALIDDVVLGIVTPVGDQGSVLPRTAVLTAGLPDTVGGGQLRLAVREAATRGAQRPEIVLGFADLVALSSEYSLGQQGADSAGPARCCRGG